MKLVYISQLRLPTQNAHGLQIMKMCESFSSNGIEVELLVPWRFNKIKDNYFSFYRLKENFKIIKIPAIDLYFLRILPEKISAFILLFSFFIFTKIYLLFNRFDLVYTREIFWSFFSSNFVFEAHNFPQKIGRLYRWLFKRVRLLVVLNSYLKNNFLKEGFSEDKILISPDAVDKDFFLNISDKMNERKSLGLPLNKKIILYSGNFYDWKGVDTFAHSIRILPIDLFFVIVGGTKQSDLERIRGILVDQKNVLILGHVPHSEIPKYIFSADILVLPNSAKQDISSFYTSPLKLFEYMAVGRPIVASDLPSLREVLDESSCVFFEPDNPESLAEKVKILLSDSSLANKIASEALVKSKKYTWDNRALEILNFVNKKND